MVIVMSALIFFLGNTTIIKAIEIEGKIHKNVYIENLDVSGLTKLEARNKLESFFKVNNDLKLIFNNNTYIMSLNDLKVEYEVENMINEAYGIGRDKDFISDIKDKVRLDLGKNHIVKLKYKYDESNIENYVKYIEKEVFLEPINATIILENNELIVSKEKYGIKLNNEALKNIVLNKINNPRYEKDKIPTESIKPTYLYKDLVKIDTILGTYETYFNKNTVNRVNNIRVAAKATSNILVNQYEEFSFNSYTSSDDFNSKLKEAPVIFNGKVKEGLGGGICQVSSTLYNAALYAGLDITHVRNHSIPSSYIDKGRDATVSKGDLDLKFKNKFSTPVFIYNQVYEDKIVSTIYGNKEDKKEIEIVTEIVTTLPNKVVVKNSNKMYEGQQWIKEKGRMGYKINTFRIYKKDDGSNEKEFIYESYYPPKNKEILRGIKSYEYSIA